MRKILFGACAVLFSAASMPAVTYAETAGDRLAAQILEICEEQWDGDYTMIEFCVEEQSSALERLTTFLMSPTSDGLTIYSNCTRDWIDDQARADYVMVEFCLEEQMSSYRRLGYGG